MIKTAELRKTLTDVKARWGIRDNIPETLHYDPNLGLGYAPIDDQQGNFLFSFTDPIAFAALLPRNIPPKEFDWRYHEGKNYVTGIRHQGSCGACVAFAALAMVEAVAKIQLDDPTFDIDLSEGELFFCHGFSYGKNCTSGWGIRAALTTIQDKGIVKEQDYGYDGRSTICKFLPNRSTTRISKIIELSNMNSMKKWISYKGPVVASFDVYEDFACFWKYKSDGGIYEHVLGDLIGFHAVCCVGYNDIERYWVMKNSWGDCCGDKGFFKISYDQCRVNTTMYGIDLVVF